jgi:hypothetical protein
MKGSGRIINFPATSTQPAHELIQQPDGWHEYNSQTGVIGPKTQPRPTVPMAQ